MKKEQKKKLYVLGLVLLGLFAIAHPTEKHSYYNEDLNEYRPYWNAEENWYDYCVWEPNIGFFSSGCVRLWIVLVGGVLLLGLLGLTSALLFGGRKE